MPKNPDNQLLLGIDADGAPVELDFAMFNRHGLISGATGTGKTITLQVLAEQLSKAGVPVVCTDVKGDLAGISQAGTMNKVIEERVAKLGLTDFPMQPFPTVLWDIFGERGHALRTTISDMGPLLLSRLLGLSDTQDAVLHLAFKFADDSGLLLLDCKDLRALLTHMSNNATQISAEYGKVAPTSIASIQRQLLVLESAGGDKFFGEPALQIQHLMQKDFSGNGIINIIDAKQLMNDGRIYGTMLLWLLSELFEELPEVGDADKPKLVFFFDEAHLLFEDAPKVLVKKVEQVVRLIRSKGVGIYFVTQNPLDIPASVRSQLGSKVQHALRSFTPRDQKAIAAVAESMPINPNFDTADMIGNLEVGYALVSGLDYKGRPTPTQHAMVRPPQSQIGTITAAQRTDKITTSPLATTYSTTIDRESAFEMLQQKVDAQQVTAPATSDESQRYYKEYETKELPKRTADKDAGGLGDLAKMFNTGKRQGYIEAFAKNVVRSVGTKLATRAIRGILGGLAR